MTLSSSGDRAGAELVGGLLRLGEVEVADRHLHALTDERLGRRLADAAGGAGDRGDLAGQDLGLLRHGTSKFVTGASPYGPLAEPGG